MRLRPSWLMRFLTDQTARVLPVDSWAKACSPLRLHLDWAVLAHTLERSCKQGLAGALALSASACSGARRPSPSQVSFVQVRSGERVAMQMWEES
jgi:hypothetical protein